MMMIMSILTSASSLCFVLLSIHIFLTPNRVYDTFDSDSDSAEGNAGGSARMGSDKSSLSSLPSIDSDHQGHTSHSKSATKRGGSADPGGYVAPPQGILAQDPSMTYAALVLYDMDMLSTEYIARIGTAAAAADDDDDDDDDDEYTNLYLSASCSFYSYINHLLSSFSFLHYIPSYTPHSE
jgi:hypothetical protein